MVKKLAGYFLMILGFACFVFFKNYSGTIISYPSLWLVISLVVELAGIYLLYISKSGGSSKLEAFNNERLERLKKIGEKILLTVDNCEIRENNYYEAVEQDGYSSIAVADAIYDPNRNHKEQYVIQSAIVYHYSNAGKKIRMVSQSFPFSKDVLEEYIEKEFVILYVSPFDKNDYLFDVQM